jgi:hypothetical protein
VGVFIAPPVPPLVLVLVLLASPLLVVLDAPPAPVVELDVVSLPVEVLVAAVPVSPPQPWMAATAMMEEARRPR